MRSRHIREAGFTLTELMVTIAIIAVMAAIAIPLFTRDTAESKYNEMINSLAQELQRAKFEALSSKEDRALIFSSKTNYQLVAMAPGDTSGSYAQLRSITLPPNTEIAGFRIGANNTSTPTAPTAVPASGNEIEIRFTAISDVELKGTGLASCGGVNCATALCPCSVTIYTQDILSSDTTKRYRHRFVIHRSTAHAERFEKW